MTVDADWIAARIDDPAVRLVEVDVNRAAYDEGHIPGAVLWNAYTDLRGPDYRAVGQAQLGDLFSRSGITPETTVVTYGYAAPLGFMLLQAQGHADARLLVGPREQWARAGNEWSTDAPEPAESVYPPPRQDARVIASLQVVEAAIADPAQRLLDVRSEAEYRGERFWPSGATEDAGRAGHVPDALSVPIDVLRSENGMLKDPADLRRVLERAGVHEDDTLIVYCTIGNRASEAWFALTHVLDYRDVRVYYGSWAEWGKTTGTPVAS